MLAIICALEEQKHFLEGATYLVEIWTDHKNFKFFIMAKKLNYKGNWGGVLQKIPQLNYTVEYITTYLQEIPQRIR